MVSSPRSGTKSTKNENSEDTPKTNVKRKRSSGKENVCILFTLNFSFSENPLCRYVFLIPKFQCLLVFIAN